MLQRALPPDCKAYFVLDGLDECDYSEREILTEQLRKLQTTFALLLCVSLRVEPNNALELSLGQFTAARVTSVPDDNPDIEAFIGAELESCIESRKLVIGEPALILEIQDALLERSEGMFLWVALQIQSLCSMKTDQAIRDALADLPKDLSETFSRILLRSEELGESYQRRILELITVAHRPLTTEELREALSVVPGDAVWNPARLLNDIYSTLTCCGCLVTIDEEELTIRLVHHSVKQFLLSGFKDSTNIAFTIDSAKRRMADIIITYLNYGVFETQLSTVVVPQIMTGSTPSTIIRSTLDSSSTVQRLALKLLKSKKRPDHDIGKTLAETRKLFSHRSVDEFHFYSYAKSYWLQHIICISKLKPVMYDLLITLFKRKAVNTNATNEDGRTPLSWAAKNGHEAVVKLLLDSGKVDVNLKNSSGDTPLSLAVQRGHEAVVKLILDSGKVDVNLKDSRGDTPLSLAVQRGDEDVVKLLLDSGKVNVNLKDSRGDTPLWLAVRDGYEAVVELLLDSGKVDVNLKDSLGNTPLSLAARNGHVAVVKLLLDSGKVDVNLKDSWGDTPLSLAVRNGHEAVVELLLDSGKVNVNLKDRQGHTPLWWATERGHEAVVKLLLDSGKVNVNLEDIVG